LSEDPHTAWVRTYVVLSDSGFRRDAVRCPFCDHSTVAYQFVGDPEKRIGALAIWCTGCERGCMLSRVGIPDGQTIVPFDASPEEIRSLIPSYAVRCQ
jgi:hypothetical protein